MLTQRPPGSFCLSGDPEGTSCPELSQACYAGQCVSQGPSRKENLAQGVIAFMAGMLLGVWTHFREPRRGGEVPRD